MATITKLIFINTLFCPLFGWETAHEIELEEATLATQLRLLVGREIGNMAKEISGPGESIDEENPAEAVKHTQRALKRSDTIYEAALVHENFIARADILRRHGKSWDMYEVKSSVNVKPELLDDVAYTSAVALNAGVRLGRVYLRLISNKYEYQGPPETLFTDHDVTDQIAERSPVFNAAMLAVAAILSSKKPPKPDLRWNCRKCINSAKCLAVKYPVFDIPRLMEAKFKRMLEAGIRNIRDIPKDFNLTDNQKVVWKAVMNGATILGDLDSALAEVEWPAHYLDFETINPALPIYPGTHPYMQLPTQFSMHICSDVGVIESHHEFLADTKKDSRLELTETLLSAVRQHGSIITYSGFENRILNQLGEWFPQHKAKLDRLLKRTIDLKSIIQKHYCHPDFHGSWSIKATLPVMVPDLSYDDLEIADGDNAAAAFQLMVRGDIPEDKHAEYRSHLLEYCKRDTLAMVRLHEALKKLASGGG